jgi:excisionase family DNA binding protein
LTGQCTQVDSLGIGIIPTILRPDELAEALHVSRALIHKWQRKNVIQFYKVGHCTLFDFDLVMTALKKTRAERRSTQR